MAASTDKQNPTVPRDFRLLIQQEFVVRCRKNPKYSLRAFAKHLGVEPSPLSAILRGKRPITLKMKNRIGLALGLNLDELSTFQEAKKDQSQFQQIALDSYAIIADWYHYAILELIKVKGFKPDVSYIARTLKINKAEANIAIERLQRTGLLEIKKGRWIDTSADGNLTNINGDLINHATIKLQTQVLEMAIKALNETPIHLRSQTSMTMAIDPRDLPEAKKRITAFRRELCSYLESNKSPTQVYQLGISLYPVSGVED